MSFFDKMFHPNRERDQAIRNARTISLTVVEQYLREYSADCRPPTFKGHEFASIPAFPRYKCETEVSRAVNKVIKACGLRRVDWKQPHDLELKVQIIGTCIRQLYLRANGAKIPVYSGAKVYGKISLDPGNKLPAYTRSFFGVEQPPSVVPDPGGRYESTTFTPFDEAFQNSNFSRRLDKMLRKYFPSER